MYKQIQAFFTSENDAESAKSQLEKLKANDLVVDEIEGEDNKLPLMPLAFAGNRTSSAPSGHGLIAAVNIKNPGKADDSPRNFTLEGEVEEEDYQAALEIIKDGDGYVDKNFFDKQN